MRKRNIFSCFCNLRKLSKLVYTGCVLSNFNIYTTTHIIFKPLRAKSLRRLTPPPPPPPTIICKRQFINVRQTLSWLSHFPYCRIYASVNRDTIGSDNGLSPIRCQAIMSTNAGLLSIGPLWTNFIKIFIQNTKLFIHKDASENIVSEMAVILSRAFDHWNWTTRHVRFHSSSFWYVDYVL